MPTRWIALIAAPLLIAACERTVDTPPAAPSPGENAALGNAAEILDTSPDSLTAPEGEIPASESAANAAD